MVKVGANIDGFKHGMGEVNSKVEEAGGGFSKLGGLALGAGVAAAAAVTGVVAFGVHAVDSATEAGQAAYEMSEKFGLLPEVASKWLAVAGPLGLSGEQVGKGFQFLSKNAEAMALQLQVHGKLAAGTVQPYKDLGISVLDSAGHVKDANQLMLEAADRFKAMKDGPEKAALAMKLFGKSGTDLIPLLNQGSAGIQDLMKQATAAGTAMSGDAVTGAHNYFLEQQKLNQQTQGLTVQIGTFLMPIMMKITDFILTGLIPAVRQGWSWFKEHLYPALVQVYSGFMQLIGPAITYIKDHFNDLKPVLEAIGIVALVALGIVVLAIGLVVGAVVGLVFVITWLSGQLRQNADSWSAAVQNFVIGGINNFRNFVSFVTGIPGNVKGAIASTAHGMWDGIWDAFKSMLNRVIGAWNSLHFTIGGGSFAGQNIPSMTLSVPHIPYFHMGGMVPGSGDVLAMLQGGERVLSRSEAGGYRQVIVHQHFEGMVYAEGPQLDNFANTVAQRLQFATGT